MFQLSGFQRDLLYVIAGLNKPSGQTLKARLEGPYGTDINHGRLYPNLDTLVKQGYIEKGQLDQRTNCYSLTDRARRELVSRRRWEDRYIGPLELEAKADID